MWRALVAAAILAACASPLGASDEPALLDIIVDSVDPRTPLAASNFTVRDAGGPLTVEALELRSLISDTTAPLTSSPILSQADEQGAARGAARLFAFFVDEFHLRESSALSETRAALARLVRTRLGPRDLVVVLKPMESLNAIRLTRDREAAARAIESAVGRLGDYTARTPFEQQFLAGTAERVDEARAQISLSALSALTAHMGFLPGVRKTLIAVSNGFTAPDGAGRRVASGFDGVGRAATIGRVAIYAVHAPDDDAGSVATASLESGAVTRDRLGALQRLAKATTGFTIVAGPRLDDDFDRVLRDASRYYVLKVRPRAGSEAGAFTAVTVGIDRDGALFRARSGFSVTAPPASGAAASRPPAPLNVPRRTSPLIRPWFGLSSAGIDRTRVSFVWERASRVPELGARRAAPETVTMRVTTVSGDPVFTGRVVSAGLAIAGAQVPRLSFDVPAGRLLVQMDILDAAGRVLDRDVRDLVVNRFAAPVAFGTPEVLRARTARELRPLLQGEDVAPTAAREFSRADHLVIRVPVVGETSEVSATLVSGLGGTMRTLTVTRLASDPAVAQLDVALAGLVSGTYVVRLNATSPTGHAADRVTFVVGP